MIKFLLFISAFFFTNYAQSYPEHWWAPVPESERQGDWEILPQAAGRGEVILSKRNELGIFSNFGHTPFSLDGERYASIEGFWQMMKYPDPTDVKDSRRAHSKEYPHSRIEVSMMHGFAAKKAGDLANVINRKYGFNNVSYKKRFFNYKDFAEGSKYHLEIIRRATIEKINQNPKAKKLLITTKGLIFKPDHIQGRKVPPSYEYYNILMKIRDDL